MDKQGQVELKLQNELNYIITTLKEDIEKVNELDDKVYLELSKEEIIDYLKYAYNNLKTWSQDFNNKQYKQIVNNYKKIESILSELELCLADCDNQFHLDGISYSLFQIGKILGDYNY